MKKEKILLVDDDENILKSFRRLLPNLFDVHTAPSGMAGLETLDSQGPFSVVVSDYRMPGLNGVEFLSQVKKKSPNTVRLMLTGQADMDAAIASVNKGHVFRFLTKPCPIETLIENLEMAVGQYRLVMAERELLRGTLRGAIKMMTELLALANPLAFGRTERIRELTDGIAAELNLKDQWRYDTAAMLSQIGCAAVDESILKKAYLGLELTRDERNSFEMHTSMARDLIAIIPRLGEVADMVFYQDKHFDGSGGPLDDKRGEDIPLGSRILKVALDYDTLVSAGQTKDLALLSLRERKAWYDPNVLEALGRIVAGEVGYELLYVSPLSLELGMVLDEDILSLDNGVLLAAKGLEASSLLLARMRSLAQNNYKLKKSVRVRRPLKSRENQAKL